MNPQMYKILDFCPTVNVSIFLKCKLKYAYIWFNNFNKRWFAVATPEKGKEEISI